jgi:outer membrane protein TolC
VRYPFLTWAVALTTMVAAPSAVRAQAPDVQVPGPEVLAPREFNPPTTAAGSLSLGDAVRSTVLRSPGLAIQSQEVGRARGQLQETSGVFDSTFSLAPALGLVNQPISPNVRNSEARKRNTLSIVADAFEELYHTMRTIAENTSTSLPVCPSGINFQAPAFVSFDRRDPQEQTLLGSTRPLFSSLLSNVSLDVEGIDLSQVCSRDVSGGIDSEILKPYWNVIDFSGGLGINGILTSAGQIRKEAFLHLTKITESVGSRIRLNLERLGPMPDVQLKRDFTLEASIGKALRSGLSFDASLRLHSEEFGFGDKLMDPNYGGFDLPPSFPSSATVTLNVPLGKGRGSTSVAAPERAAALTVTAQEQRLRHTVTSETFRTVVSYVNLIGAQQSLALLNQSLARQQNIVQLTDARVQAGDLANFEANRARARQANVASAVASAQANVTSARLGLADAMGIEVRQISDAPTATDQFPTVIPPAPPPVDLDAAVGRRHDIRALERLSRASSLIAAGAAADLRKTFDFQVQGGLSTLYESPLNRFQPDEQDPIYSDFTPIPVRLSPTRYYNPLGLYRSLTRHWEPFVAGTFTIGIPFGNNAAKGRLAQARAAARSDQVQTDDLRRTIGEGVVSATGALARAARAWAAQDAAVAASTQAVAGALQRFQAGEITLFDLLVTEEQLTSDQLQRLQQQQEYFSILARLRYETGELVTFDNEGTPMESIGFRGGQFVTR